MWSTRKIIFLDELQHLSILTALEYQQSQNLKIIMAPFGLLKPYCTWRHASQRKHHWAFWMWGLVCRCRVLQIIPPLPPQWGLQMQAFEHCIFYLASLSVELIFREDTYLKCWLNSTGKPKSIFEVLQMHLAWQRWLAKKHYFPTLINFFNDIIIPC